MNGYNSEKYLKEAIDSIYAQTFKDWEIIFIDNCSTDSTKSIVDSYDEKIKYYKTDKNIPLGEARNFGLQYCKGKYLAFLDTDDIWLNDKLEKQIIIMDEYPKYQLCYGGVVYIDKNSNTTGKFLPKAKSGDVFAQQLKKYEINMQSVVLRNNIDIKINENLRHSPDFDLFMDIASKFDIYVVKGFLVKYRKLDNSLTSKNIDVWWKEMKYTLDSLCESNKALKKKYNSEFKSAYAKVAYYRSQYLISIGKKSEAVKELYNVRYVNVIYFILYVISLFPDSLWYTVHKYK